MNETKKSIKAHDSYMHISRNEIVFAGKNAFKERKIHQLRCHYVHAKSE